MRIMIVGNDPGEIGGVANYTRPLALEFVRQGHEVFYFFSGAWNRSYNWLFRPYLRTAERGFPFESVELVNSPNWISNFEDLLLDISAPATERIFENYIRKVRPDIIHVHSRLGLPLSIFDVAASLVKRVVNTVHVYGLLCPRRVLIDRHGESCPGPEDLAKCAACGEAVDRKKAKLFARLHRTNKSLLAGLVRAKRSLSGRPEKPDGATPTRSVSGSRLAARQDALRRRLNFAVSMMNSRITLNICVSSDVKKTLMRYGVHEERLLVQPIGTALAEVQKGQSRRIHSPLVIGNIGGVGYYKGTHVLVEAVNRLRGRSFLTKIFGRFEKDFVDRIMAGKRDLPIEFKGAYVPEELPSILDEIDIMVLPSICSDTAPQTLFESYSAGIPVIASDIGGFPDFIEDGVNGRLFKPADSEALASGLVDILDHPERLRSFSKRIPRLKTMHENAQELLKIYERPREGANSRP